MTLKSVFIRVFSTINETVLTIYLFKSVTDDTKYVNCVLEPHKIWSAGGFESNTILKRLVDKKKTITNDTVYDNIKALLETCNEIAKNWLGTCLVKNSNRFGLNARNKIIPYLKLELTLKDLLKDGVNTTSCRELSSTPLKNIYDIFVIEFI